MVRILFLAHKFRGEDQKKKFSARNLRLSLGVHSCFSSWNEILLSLAEALAVFWGHQAPYFLLGHNPRLGGTLLAWEAQSVSWGGGGAQPQVPTVAPGLQASFIDIICICKLMESKITFCLFLSKEKHWSSKQHGFTPQKSKVAQLVHCIALRQSGS